MKCYVTNPSEGSALPMDLNFENTLFYPEAGMTTIQQLTTGCPKDFNIVTDCPYFVPLYPFEDVFIWRNGRWTHPDRQTYGASFEWIIREIFGYEASIPAAVLDGKITNVMGSALMTKNEDQQ